MTTGTSRDWSNYDLLRVFLRLDDGKLKIESSCNGTNGLTVATSKDMNRAVNFEVFNFSTATSMPTAYVYKPTFKVNLLLSTNLHFLPLQGGANPLNFLIEKKGFF